MVTSSGSIYDILEYYSPINNIIYVLVYVLFIYKTHIWELQVSYACVYIDVCLTLDFSNK